MEFYFLWKKTTCQMDPKSPTWTKHRTTAYLSEIPQQYLPIPMRFPYLSRGHDRIAPQVNFQGAIAIFTVNPK